MKISEYQTNRHAEAVRRREEREQAAYEAYKAAAELADAHAELEQLLADARASLTPTPTQGEQGPKGDKGDTGLQGVQGEPGANGANGATFTPSVASDGTLSWTNDGGLDNPPSVNIMGPAGTAWTRDIQISSSELLQLSPLDGHEYYLSEVQSLFMTLPADTYYEFWMEIKMSSGPQHMIVTNPSLAYIGTVPSYLPSCTYEMSVKNGVAVVKEVGADT